MNTEERLEKARKAPRASQVHKHTIRTRKGELRTLDVGRKQAIQLFCTECLGWETHPRDCTAKNCALHPFRGLTMASQ